MASPNIPKHIKADVQKLAYDRAIESIQRICDTFDNSADFLDFLALASSASMNASMLMLYCATRLKYGPEISPQQLYKIWGETMQNEFDMMAKGFDAAKQYAKEYHEK